METLDTTTIRLQLTELMLSQLDNHTVTVNPTETKSTQCSVTLGRCPVTLATQTSNTPSKFSPREETFPRSPPSSPTFTTTGPLGRGQPPQTRTPTPPTIHPSPSTSPPTSLPSKGPRRNRGHPRLMPTGFLVNVNLVRVQQPTFGNSC